MLIFSAGMLAYIWTVLMAYKLRPIIVKVRSDSDK